MTCGARGRRPSSSGQEGKHKDPVAPETSAPVLSAALSSPQIPGRAPRSRRAASWGAGGLAAAHAPALSGPVWDITASLSPQDPGTDEPSGAPAGDTGTPQGEGRLPAGSTGGRTVGVQHQPVLSHFPFSSLSGVGMERETDLYLTIKALEIV